MKKFKYLYLFSTFILLNISLVFNQEEFTNLITSSTKIVYYDDFEINDGGLTQESFNTQNNYELSTCNSCIWGWANVDHNPPSSGYFCWGTAPFSEERLDDYHEMFLFTPWVKGSKTRLTFDSNLDHYGNDLARIEYRTSTTDWTLLESFHYDYGWISQSFDTPELNADSTQFRFFYDKEYQNYINYGWYIDNLMIESYQTSITHEELLDTYNNFGPYKFSANLSESIEWTTGVNLVYSINGGATFQNNGLFLKNIVSNI